VVYSLAGCGLGEKYSFPSRIPLTALERMRYTLSVLGRFVAKKREATTLTDQIREKIQQSGVSLLSLSMEAKVSYPVLHGFVHGERDIRASSLDKICNVLKLRIVQD
jgi:hypothetical protein